MAEMQCSLAPPHSCHDSPHRRPFLPLSLLRRTGIKTNSILFDSVPAPLVPVRAMPGAAAARSVARSVGSADSIHSTYLFARRASSGDVAVPRPTAVAAAPHRRRRRRYLPQRSRRPPSPSSPSFLRLSVSRSFLRGNWMTQKASQVSAARRCGDATRRAGRQISCSPPNGRDSPTGPRCARSNCRAECELDCENESEFRGP